MSELSAIRSGIRRQLVSLTIPVTRPSASTPTTITSASSTSFARGAYVTITSSGDLLSHALTGLIVTGATATVYELDIASGAAGAEIVRGTYTFAVSGNGANFPVLPAVQIPANERVAARIGSGDASTAAASISLKANFTPRPF